MAHKMCLRGVQRQATPALCSDWTEATARSWEL